MRTLITLLATVFIMFSQANAQEKPLPLEEIQKVASEALVTFNELVTKENYTVMGFESLSEARVASLGEHLRVFMVRLDQLQKYQPGSDPNNILSGGDLVIYPVIVEEQVRSSIVVEKVKERWNATSFAAQTRSKCLPRCGKLTLTPQDYLFLPILLCKYRP